MFSPTSPVSGTAQTGFTAPTYTLTTDTAPASNGKQYAVTAVGGTQAGVTAHTVQSPFTLTWIRPLILKLLPVGIVSNSVIKNIPRNTYTFITRKGVSISANQPAVIMTIRTEISVPAGADTFDPANIKAAIAAHGGTLSQQSAGIGDTCLTGISG